MIKAERKPLDKIIKMLAVSDEPKKVLVAGCGTCVTICFAGGEQEVELLVSQLKLRAKSGNGAAGLARTEFVQSTPQRQCELEYIENLADEVAEAEAVISMACGVGVQVMAQRFPDTPVYPALDTTFMGPPARHGVWIENCAGCGDCIIGYTAGVCPVARCAKSMMNGPCGGSQNGKCEVDREIDCAWALIFEGLKNQGKLRNIMSPAPAKNWSTSAHGGQRKIVREDIVQ